MRPENSARLPMTEKAGLFVRIWVLALVAEIASRRQPLPAVMARYRASVARPGRKVIDAVKLSRAVTRTLRLGPWQPRCLIRSVVLYRLAREQGESVELVIGLPGNPTDHLAHAWVELNGADIGPAPGRGDHEELARYG